MSTSGDFDRQVRDWLELGPTVLSDVALDAARAEVHLTRQRRVLRVPRRNPMSQSSRLLVAAIAGLAAVVVVGVGLRMVTGPSNVGNPIPSASNLPSIASASPLAASPTASATASLRAFPKVPAMASEGALPLAWKASGPAPSSVATGAPTIDPSGRIWVPSGFDSKFWIFSSKGKFLESWGSPGTADGQFDFVYKSGADREADGGIAFAADGSFWVADTGNHRVQHFDKDRRFLESLTVFAKPVAVALNDGGDIYVDDAGPREIQEYNSRLAHILTFASGVAGRYLSQEQGWVGTDALPDGRPGWTSYKPDGTYQGSLDLSDVCHFPAGEVQNPNGDMFIACMTGDGANARPEGLFMAGATGTALHFWSTGGAGIAISPAGDAVYLTTPGSPDLSAYTLPAKP